MNTLQVELINLHEVRRITGMSTTFIYTKMAEGRFPARVKIGRAARWLRSDVLKWVADQINQ